MSYPDFFVIGAMKAGTSTLHRNVLVHPEICLTRDKEVNYFLTDLPRRILQEKYRNQFERPQLLKGDVSPSYSKSHLYPGVAERIFSAQPEAKIIFITRDPLQRIQSHLYHNLLRHRFDAAKVEREVFENPDYIMSSSYHFQIRQYLNHFRRTQVLVVTLEELITKPSFFYQKVMNFLGLSPAEFSADRKFNISEKRYQIKHHDFVHKHIRSRQLLKLYHLFWYFRGIRPSVPVLSESIRKTLVDRLAPDTLAFAKEFDLDLNSWPNFSEYA